jgi:hypothetical protein
MKKLYNLLGIITIGAVIVVSTLAFTGCDNGTTSNAGNNTGNNGGNNTAVTPTTGTITINNTSGNYVIAWVKVNDVTTKNDILDESASIAAKGGSETYTVDPGKYIVTIRDGSGYNASSTQFQLNAGGSKTLTFTGLELY